MKKYLLLLPLIALAACSHLSPEQKQTLADSYQQMLTEGKITIEQYNALMGALNGSKDWIGQAVETALTIGFALLGVRWYRGPATKEENIVKASTAKAVIKAAVTPPTPK